MRAFRAIVAVLTLISLAATGPGRIQAAPLEDFITELYQQVLLRTPGAGEVASYASYLRAVGTLEAAGAVARAFLTSAEFTTNAALTPDSYVDTLYAVLLGRLPDPAGYAWFLAAVQARFDTLLPAFIDSPEFRALIITTPPAVVVGRLYMEVLGRSPSGGEDAAWVALGTAGDYVTVVRGFFDSQEYTSTPRTMGQHVRILYRALLGRDPEPTGQQAWVSFLAGQLATLVDVMVASGEYRARLLGIINEPPFLTAEDVTAVVAAAVTAVNLPLVVAVVDRMGNPLAVFSKPGAPATALGNFSAQLPADEVALSLARTGAFFSNNQAPLSSRTVRFISGIHFPPGVANKANAALYGIENTNRGCAVTTPYNPGMTINPPQALNGLPCNAFDRRGCSLGITTGKADVVDSNPLALNGGGVPIFKDGVVVGGVGVAGPPVLVAEFAALVGSIPNAHFGPRVPDPGAIYLDGIALPFVGQTTQPPGTAPDTFAGSFSLGPMASPLGPAGVPDGWLIGPRAGSQLSAAEVNQIVGQAIAQANRTRAAIRLPLGSTTRMMIAVADLDGSILGLFRMPDATIFSVDVATTKARNVIYFSSATRNPFDLPFVPPGYAVTNRTISFGAQPLFPPGIDQVNGGSGPGPFFPLYLNDVALACTQGSEPANLNQSGIVFFPGSTPLHRNGVMVGGLGVSGDGVEQDDLVTAAGATGFAPDPAIRADQILINGIRLPYLKFPRNPEDL